MAQILDDADNPAPKGWFARPCLTLFAVFAAILAIPIFKHEQDWITVYIPAAARLADGGDVFQESSGFVYPPINAWLALPFRSMPRVPGILVWHAVNMAALSILIVGAWRLSGGGPLDGLPQPTWRERAIFWFGLACGISSCIDAVTNQQTDLIIAALCILGCTALARHHAWQAGAWFGVAAAIKCTPLLWAPYLAWRRQWGPALVVVAVSIGVNLVPDLTHPPTAEPRLAEWTARFLLPMAEQKHEFGTWTCGIGGNQSLPGLWQRWLAYDPVFVSEDLIGQRSNSAVAPETLKAVSWTSMALLLAAGLLCTARIRNEAMDDGMPPPTHAFEYGLVLMLMVMLSPHSSQPHYCTLVLPGFCVARLTMTGANRLLKMVLWGAIICALLPNNDLVGSWIYSWAKWHASLLWSAMLLFAASCWTLATRSTNNARVLPFTQLKDNTHAPIKSAA